MNKYLLNYVIFVVIILILVTGMIVYDTYDANNKYLSGEFVHYQGESFITKEQSAVMVSELGLGYYRGITEYELNDDGTVRVVYDYYNRDTYDYLNKLPYASSDAPMIKKFRESISTYIIGVIGMLFVALMTTTTKSKRDPKVARISRAVQHAIWYLNKPAIWFKTPKISYNHSADIRSEIKIDESRYRGILGARTWKYYWRRNTLYSVGYGSQWDDKLLYTDDVPDDENFTGVHAYRLGALDLEYAFVDEIIGIVELGGEYAEHEDEVIRAQSCEMILLIVHSFYRKRAVEISSRYGVPVMVSDNPIFTYQSWIMSHNGIECLKHNARLLEGDNEYEREDNTERESSGEISSDRSRAGV